MYQEITSPHAIGTRYEIVSRIGAGGMGVVYRALDRLSGQLVALKQVTTPGEQLEFASSGASTDFRLSLAQEFKTLSSMRHPNIISVLDYGFDVDRQPYYTMELLEDSDDIIEAAAERSYDEKLDLLVQLLQALTYLHRRGIIHRDLKPDNVVVINNQVKVLDFGLAIARQFVPEDEGVIGTLAYMAPEVLQSSPASEASDLYAVGIMAFELFAGQHPFNVRDIASLVHDTLAIMPDFSVLSVLDVEYDLVEVIERLLMKEPAERYSNARAVIDDLASATGKQFVLETDTIRESYLQAATFVGRDEELDKLIKALRRITFPRRISREEAPPPKGSLWLVAGESGVGKSRLLDELRSQALVEGALVLRGQAVQQGGASYQVWRDVLRYLCLQTTLTDMEASVLKPLVPDIDKLLERPIPQPSTVDAPATQSRLLNVIEMMFMRQIQPIVLLLEDLHWANEGLQVIKRLTSIMDKKPLMIIGSYRDDEAPHLADDYLEAELIVLDRLESEEIIKLSESMLGPVGKQPEVINFLERETEGNVFFIVEVVRALAEEAGQLDQIARMTLPESVFANGMRAIIQHRLNRLPESALLLLQVAAIGGRELDMNILQFVPTEMNFDDWLFVCEMETVLEIEDNKWRFVHDKLREQLLDDLSDEAKAALHQYYAEATESVYGDDPDWTMTLAHHWERAGNNQKVAHYTAIAGEQALGISAYDRAIKYINSALELNPPKKEEAMLERYLAEAYYGLGEINESLVHTRKALKLMDMAGLARENWKIIGRIFQQIARQALHRLFPRFVMGRNADDSDRLLTAAVLHIQTAQAYVFSGESLPGILSALYALNIAEKAHRSPELAYSYAATAFAAVYLKMPWMVKYYLNAANKTMSTLEIGDDRLQIKGMVKHAAATIHIGCGHLQQANMDATDALAIFEEVGDQRRWSETLSNLALIDALKGDLRGSLQYRKELSEVARHDNKANAKMWSLAGMGQIEARTGNLDTAITHFNERAELIKNDKDSDEKYASSTYLTLAYYRRGEIEEAKKHLKQAVAEVEQLGYTQIHDIFSFFNVLEISIMLWEQTGSSEFQSIATAIMKRTRAFADIYPVAEARHKLWQGLMLWTQGKHTRALQIWKQALEYARRFGMRYDEALIEYIWGAHLPVTDSLRTVHLLRAIEIFREIGAEWDLAKAREALDATP